MKKIILMAMAVSSLAACSAMDKSAAHPHKVGMANPASEYCIEQGGKLEIKDEANGQAGYCRLPNGAVVEEWAFFRASQAHCLPEEAQKLVGKTGLSDTQIKQLTKSETVRHVEPGQAVTMDYRDDRVTVRIDPVSNKITHASCG